MSFWQFTLIVSLGLNVLFALLVFRLATTHSATLTRSHERTTEYTEGLLDRLMAVDYGTLKSYQLAEMQASAQAPEEVPPDEWETVAGPDLGGFGSRLGLSAWRPNTPEEAEARSADEEDA